MIKLLYINPTGMFSFFDMPLIPLDSLGTVYIGGRNGHGKSSIINSLKEILFSKNDTEKSGINVINKHKNWKGGMFGVVIFEKDGIQWRVLNVRKWKGNPPDGVVNDLSQIIKNNGSYTGSDIFLERFDCETNTWIDERPTSKVNKSLNDTQQKVIDILGITYDQFSSYICLGQNLESALVSGTSSTREKIIQTVTDVSVWNRAIDITKVKISEYGNGLVMLENRINGMNEILNNMHVPTEELNKIENEINMLNIEKQKYSDELDFIMWTMNEFKINTNFNEKDNKFIEDINGQIEFLEIDRQHSITRFNNLKLPDVPVKINEINIKISDLEAVLRLSKNTLNQMKTMKVGICSSCNQSITEEYLGREIITHTNNINTTEAELQKLKSELQKLKSEYELNVSAIKLEAKEKYDIEISSINEAKNKLLAKITDHNNIVSQMNKYKEEYNTIYNNKLAVENKISLTWNTINNIKNKITEINDIKSKIELVNNERNETKEYINHLEWIERNFKKVRLQEYETKIERLNQLMAEILKDLWGSGLYARFVTAKSTTRGTGVVSQLELLVTTDYKEDVPVEMYSGGETKIIVVAAFLAMRQLACENGIIINLISVDELDSDLDDINTDKLVNVFQYINNVCSTCFVISHNIRLLNTMRFDRKWTMLKVDEVSTIEMESV